MSVKYKAVARPYPGVGGAGEKKYYASIVRGEKVDMRSFVEEIAESNTLQTADVMAVLESFLKSCTRHLSNGRTIDMGQLGYFSPTLHSTGEVDADAVDKKSIKRFKINFLPSHLLKKALLGVTFERVNG